MSVPTYQGSVGVMRAVVACLEAEIGAVLDAANTGLSLTLDDPRSYWRGEQLPADWNSPGIGVWIATSCHVEPSGLNLYDVDHEVVVSLVMAGDNGGCATLSEFTDAQHAYAQAVSYTLNRYFSTSTSYGGAVGCFKATTLDSTPLPVDDIDGGQFLAHTQIRFSIMQRVARWEA